MAVTGRKSLNEELGVFRRFEQLTPKVFALVEKMLDSKKKEDQLWALDWLKNGYAKLIPQIIQGDPDNPIVFMPSDLMQKNEITSDKVTISPLPENGSAGHAPVQDSQLRAEVGQDNPGGVGNGGQSGEQTKPTDSLPSPDLPAGEGHSVDSFIESLPANSN